MIVLKVVTADKGAKVPSEKFLVQRVGVDIAELPSVALCRGLMVGSNWENADPGRFP